MTQQTTQCPICDASVTAAEGTVESELITCSDCDNMLVVTRITNTELVLEEAPDVEEDWGE